MDWKRLLAYITGGVDHGLLLRNEYLASVPGRSRVGKDWVGYSNTTAAMPLNGALRSINKRMTMTVSTDDPQFVSTIQACAVALRRLASYEMAPSSTVGYTH